MHWMTSTTKRAILSSRDVKVHLAVTFWLPQFLNRPRLQPHEARHWSFAQVPANAVHATSVGPVERWNQKWRKLTCWIQMDSVGFRDANDFLVLDTVDEDGSDRARVGELEPR